MIQRKLSFKTFLKRLSKYNTFDDINDERVFVSIYNLLISLNYQFMEEIILVPKTILLILNRIVVLEMNKKKLKTTIYLNYELRIL